MNKKEKQPPQRIAVAVFIYRKKQAVTSFGRNDVTAV
jgi:hypothetical protein